MNRRKKKIKKKIISTVPELKENSRETNREFLMTLSVFSNADNEVRSKIFKECDIILECFHCKKIFRSLFALREHRFNYCPVKDHIPTTYACESTIAVNEKKFDPTIYEVPHSYLTKNISGSQYVKYIQDTQSLSSEANKLKYYNSLLKFTEIKHDAQYNDTKIFLQPIQNTKVAVYQTILFNSQHQLDNLVMIGDQIEEINEIERNKTYYYNKKNIIKKNPIECEMCDRHYRTDQTLSYHFSRCHAKKRVYHPCPICKMNFPNHHYATKHIIHVHHKQIHQIRKLRPVMKKQIYEKVFTDYEINNFLDSNNPPEVINNQNVKEIDNYDWMKNFEQDTDIQKCGGCGIRFERRAALMSHSQFCQLRIAAKNKYTRIY